jgi:uncharacterized membrane protein
VPTDITAPGATSLRADAAPTGPVPWLRAFVTERVTVTMLVYGTVALWAAAFSSGAAFAQSRFLLRRYDLGNFTQAVWATAHGHFLQVTEVGGDQVSRLGIHVDPIMVLLVPLWWAWPSPTLLLVVQAVALAAGALPVFWLARKHLESERQAGLLTVAYLLYPSLGWNAFHEFHAVALAVPLLMLAIWFLDENRLWAFFAAAAGAMICQEQIGALVACLGIWYALRRRRVARGLVIAATGLLVTALDFAVVLPHFSAGSPYNGRYVEAGGSFGGIAQNVVLHPLTLIQAVHASDLVAFVYLLLPVFGICLRSSLTWCALPQAALLVLANGDWDPMAQNALPLIPFIYMGTVFALARRGRLHFGARHVLFATSVMALLIVGLAVGGSLRPFVTHVPSSAHLTAERHAIALVPTGAAVSATDHLGSHLATRRVLYVFPVIGNADWVVVDSRDNGLPSLRWLRDRKGIEVGAHDVYWQPRLMRRTLRFLAQSPDWETAFQSHGISVFRRIGPTAGA